VVRRGRLRLRGWTAAVSAFADVDLDLREATIDQPQTTVAIVAVCGNIDVYIPEGVNVDVTGVTLSGHRRDWGNDVTVPNAPTITVRAAGVFGTIDIWRVPATMHDATHRDVIRYLED
jgi:Cell wall-active antibiotics response 4TMS YvqF